MLDNLTERLAKVVKTMRGEARLTEENTAETLREIRLALLEADVALPVVREFISAVRQKVMGEEVIGSLTPGQAFVGVVLRELTRVIGGDLGEDASKLNFATVPPAVILMAGLQGAGKTTTAAKLAKHLVGTQKKKVLTVSADVYRPAAIKQLETVTAQAGADFYTHEGELKPLVIAKDAIEYAKRRYYDVVIFDTAGRLTIDEEMMAEIKALHEALNPIETLFVIDAMSGQDAMNTAKAFNDAVNLTGIVLTKTDGDARGGAALSVRHVTGRPIKFVGVSEKIDGLEPFDPRRAAERILGMGDIVALVEKVKETVNIETAKKIERKMRTGERFDLEDFKEQMEQMQTMGGFAGMMDKMPAQFRQAAAGTDPEQATKNVARMVGIINSMTPQERKTPTVIKASRKRRIATGAGVKVQDVNRLLNQFEQVQSMMKKVQKGGMGKLMRGLRGMMG